MFPPVFGSHAYVGGTRGLTISVLLVLLLANLVELNAIASLVSVVALVILVLAAETLRTEPETFVAMIGIVLALVLDLIPTRVRRHRRETPPAATHE